MKTCEAVWAIRPDSDSPNGSQRVCGAPATYSAYGQDGGGVTTRDSSAEAPRVPKLILLEPQDYLKGSPAVHSLRLERVRNRHTETNGESWGWYEIRPLRITIGYWGSDRDDLKGVDIAAWNKRAAGAINAAKAKGEK